MAIVIIVLASIVAAWVAYQVYRSNRDLALERVARRLGMNFRHGIYPDLRELLPRFRALETATDRGGDFLAGVNSITGTYRGRRIAFFDYDWSVVHPLEFRRSWWGADDSRRRTTKTRSAVAVELGVGLQPVLIRPESLVDKAMAIVGYDDIDFEHLPEFSGEFYVASPDRAATRRLVTPALAQYFRQHVDFTVDIVGPWMLLTRDRELRAGELQDLMDVAGRLSELVTREQSRLR